MKELDNFIYFDVCLYAIDQYNSLDFKMKQSNFHYYCICVKDMLLEITNSYQIGGKINRVILDHIHLINEKIVLIYSLPTSESVDYIYNFFLNEEYLKFSEPALLIKQYFRNSFL
jgi:hypothetical protein